MNHPSLTLSLSLSLSLSRIRTIKILFSVAYLFLSLSTISLFSIYITCTLVRLILKFCQECTCMQCTVASLLKPSLNPPTPNTHTNFWRFLSLSDINLNTHPHFPSFPYFNLDPYFFRGNLDARGLLYAI